MKESIVHEKQPRFYNFTICTVYFIFFFYKVTIIEKPFIMFFRARYQNNKSVTKTCKEKLKTLVKNVQSFAEFKSDNPRIKVRVIILFTVCCINCNFSGKSSRSVKFNIRSLKHGLIYGNRNHEFLDKSLQP